MSDRLEEIRGDCENGLIAFVHKEDFICLLSEIDRIQAENDKLRDDLADLQCWYDALRAEAISLAKGSDD